MDDSRLQMLRNHLSQQSEEQRRWLIAEGLRLGDEDVQMRLRAKMATALRGRTIEGPLHPDLRGGAFKRPLYVLEIAGLPSSPWEEGALFPLPRPVRRGGAFHIRWRVFRAVRRLLTPC